MNLEQLQNAINILYNPQNSSQQVREQAQIFCNEFIQNYAVNLIDFFTFFAQTDNQPMKFWLLKAIVEIINNFYAQVIVTPEQHQMLHQVFFQLLKEKPDVIFSQKHCENKYALIFIMLVREDYPNLWPEAFTELLSLIKLTQDVNLQKQYMDISMIKHVSNTLSIDQLLTFCIGFIVKCLLVFEEELVERSDKKSAFLLEQQNRVKDGIRNSSISDIIFVLSQVLQNYQVFDEDLVNDTLEVLSQLIDWNALELFAGQIDIIKSFLANKKFRTNALSCIHSIAYKGMDYPLKVELIVNLGFLDILESFKIKFRERPGEDSEYQDEQEDEEEFFETMSEAVDKLGQWCLELFQNEAKLLPSVQHQQQYEQIFLRTLVLALDLLDTDKPKIGRNALNFLNFWLQGVKKYYDQPTSNIPPAYLQIFQKLLEIVIRRVKYPDWCTYQEGNVLSEHEEDYHLYREEVVVLFINLAQIKVFHDQFLQTLALLFQSIVPGQTPFNQAEVPLFLAYHLHQAIPHNMKDQPGNVYSDLMQYIIKIDFFAYEHKIVSLMLLENLIRYLQYFIKDPNFQNQIVTIFFSKKAIMSNEPQLASRSCYLLLRLTERGQNELTNQAPQIIESTLQIIGKVETGQHQEHLISYDDLQYLYNIIGIFVSNKKLDYEYRRQIVIKVLDALMTRLQNCQPFEKDNIIWVLKFLNVFTKGFQQEISNMMKESFGKALQTVLNILPQNLNHQVICDLVLSYLQRNVNLLGSDVKPYFTLIAQPFIQNIDFERMDLFLTIINYTGQTLKTHATELIDTLFLDLLQKMSSAKIPETDTSDIEKNYNRVFAGFFRIIFTYVEIDSTFLFSQNNAPYFSNFITYLVEHLDKNLDKNTRKTILHIFKELFIDFSGLTQQQLSQFGRKSQGHSQDQQMKDKSIVNTQPQAYQQFVEQLLWISSKYIFQLNPQSLDDHNLIKSLSDIQALLYIGGFGEQLSKVLHSTINNIEITQVIIQMCDSLAQKQINTKQMQEQYVVSLIIIIQQSYNLQKLLTQLRKQ